MYLLGLPSIYLYEPYISKHTSCTFGQYLSPTHEQKNRELKQILMLFEAKHN